MRLKIRRKTRLSTCDGHAGPTKVREYSHSGTEAPCDGVCYSLKVFGSRCEHYLECGDECKTGQGTGPTRDGLKLHTTLRRCGHIPWNLSLLAAASMVASSQVEGKSLNLWGMVCTYSVTAPLLTEIRHCLTRNTRNRTILRGPNLSSRPFASASGDLHVLFPFLFGTW